MKFSALNPGAKFEMWSGDALPYADIKLCSCEKIESRLAREILNPSEAVLVYGAPFVLDENEVVVVDAGPINMNAFVG